MTVDEVMREGRARANGQDATELLGGIRNGEWLDRQTFAPPRWHVEGIVAEGYTLLVGPPKLGKSWFVLGVGLASASGGTALGRLSVAPRPVLYLALEDGPRRLQDRARRLLVGGRLPPAWDFLTRATPEEIVPLLAAWLDRHRDAAPLAILDTLGRVMPPALSGESPYQRDYRIGAALKGLADDVPGSAVVVNHHVRKAGSDDFVDAVSGTNGLAGAADSIIVLTRRRGESTGLLQVTGRDVEEAAYALTFRRDEAWQLDGEDLVEAATRAAERQGTEGLGDVMARVVAYVDRNSRGVRATDVATVIGIAESTARQYLSRAAEADRITRCGRGVYRPVASVASVAFDTDAQVTPLFRDGSERDSGVASVAFGDDDPEDEM